MDKPIPAFYACYLLRSTIRHSSLYVGSTPNPARRLKQHNGESRGGAVRTSRNSLRPWEMTCLVTGFPSKIAALQFEWAWQNTHLTRHVPADSRLALARSATRISPKTGRERKRPARPRLCLSDRLANLHLLLQASSFERWPLKLTFYSEDVYQVWMKWASQHIEQLRPGIGVVLDDSVGAAVSNLASNPKSELHVPKGIPALDVSYLALKSHLEKSRKLVGDANWLHCSVCTTGIPSSGAMTLTCPHDRCDLLAHMECLSERFLHFEKDPDAIVPTSGICPSCGTELQWVDLVKELSLRMHGEKEISALFKTKRCRKAKDHPALLVGESGGSEGEDGGVDAPTILDDVDDWHTLSDGNDEGNGMQHLQFDPNAFAKSSALCVSKPTTPQTELVVEDSDWEEAQVLT